MSTKSRKRALGTLTSKSPSKITATNKVTTTSGQEKDNTPLPDAQTSNLMQDGLFHAGATLNFRAEYMPSSLF